MSVKNKTQPQGMMELASLVEAAIVLFSEWRAALAIFQQPWLLCPFV